MEEKIRQYDALLKELYPDMSEFDRSRAVIAFIELDLA